MEGDCECIEVGDGAGLNVGALEFVAQAVTRIFGLGTQPPVGSEPKYSSHSLITSNI